MDLGLGDDQQALVDTFALLCAREATPERVRAAEPGGFDPELWLALVDFGAPAMGAPDAAGGAGATLLDLALVAEVLGGALAPVPVVEHTAAVRALAGLVGPGDGALADLVAGAAIGTVVPVPADAVARVVPAGGIARFVLALDGDHLVLVEQEPPGARTPNLGAAPVAPVDLRGPGRRILAEGASAREAWAGAVDEWRVLTAAALVGLGARALDLGVEYAKSRHQFGVPIGSFQSIARDLADAATAVDGARLLAREAAWAEAAAPDDAHALAAMALVFAADTAQQASATALHTHGGYGFMLEYDVQLYYRRAKAWALLAGDPRRIVAELGDALFGPVTAGCAAPGGAGTGGGR